MERRKKKRTGKLERKKIDRVTEEREKYCWKRKKLKKDGRE